MVVIDAKIITMILDVDDNVNVIFMSVTFSYVNIVKLVLRSFDYEKIER